VFANCVAATCQAIKQKEESGRSGGFGATVRRRVGSKIEKAVIKNGPEKAGRKKVRETGQKR